LRSKAIILLSGGLDSTFNFYRGQAELDIVVALTMDYGQRALPREVHAAAKIAAQFRVPHQVIPFPFLQNLGGSSLVDRDLSVPQGSAVDIQSQKVSESTAQSVWVPNRNGLFLNAAACFADRWDAEWVIAGFNAEEAATFPDNSEAFLKALDHAFAFSTRNQVKVKCYSLPMNKTEIVAECLKLKFDFSAIWPCYFAGEKWCGSCESCLRTQRALKFHKISTEGLFLC